MIADEKLEALASRIAALDTRARRLRVAVAGPPGAGKSTLAAALVDRLGPAAALVPMDGFHLDNRLLEPAGLLPRKGAPETFDAAGFTQLIRRLGDEAEVIHPVFDRVRDIAVAGAARVGPETRIVVAEGNYLLLDEPAWRPLHALWDFSVLLREDRDELTRRLIGRWLDHGHTPAEADARARANDLPNAERVLANSVPADLTL